MELLWQRLNGRSGHEVGRLLLSELYRSAQGEPLPSILHTQQGKPYFEGNPLHFSISHTKTHAFCCLSHTNVGMDAEPLDRKVDPRIAGRFLSPAEQRRLDASACKEQALLRLWVLKESYAKLTGRGLGDYLRQTDFDPNDPRIQIIDGCFVAVLSE